MISVVPGAKVGPDGPAVGAGWAIGGGPEERPTSSPTPSSAARTTTTSAHTQPRRPLVRGSGGGSCSNGGGIGGGGASTGERCTATPGPAGVATSDQPAPFHQRTIPGVPSGSGYQPGAGRPGSLTVEL